MNVKTKRQAASLKTFKMLLHRMKRHFIILPLLCICATVTAQDSIQHNHANDTTDVFFRHLKINEVKVRLDALNPNNVLTRGYSYVCDKSGRAIESARAVKKGDNVSIVLSDGSLLSEIKDISINKDGGANDA